ncbi:unnamed protein product [Ambrosiozyma monospora]|uniref:Mitochondrial zinc maintenance protein 1, mitochondrial n=1 Tax=Ambrosiozyma monospora TaxID=43982 RepID=A0A9W6YYX3_AMBMO|nr:unnamed protein product [Ambrosiozyma monospora]
MSQQLAKQALSSYRNALRATRIAFTTDTTTLNAARLRIKTEMKLLQSKENPEMSIQERIQLLDQVSIFLRKNIVQGIKEDKEPAAETEAASGEEKQKKPTYFLNIHKDTELGDNDSIKKSKGKKNSLTGKVDSAFPAGSGCCGGGNITLNQR